MRPRILLCCPLLLLGILMNCGGASHPDRVCTDVDGDAFAVEGGLCGEVDCDDTDPQVNPGIQEQFPGDPVCSDEKDNDCDGLVDAQDPDCQEEADCQDDGDCDDGLFCNGAEGCEGGSCLAGTPVNCGDGDPCTNDSCNEAADACTHTCNATGPQSACCTQSAVCAAAPVCQGECRDDGDCDDGLFCNGAERCTGGSCVAGTPVTCNDSNGCTDDVCVEATKNCRHTCNASSNQDVCCNNAACAQAPVCQGECEVDGDCDDGLFCNGSETCVGRECREGTRPCEDGNVCTTDTCNEAADRCGHLCNATGSDDPCCSNAACWGAAACDGEPFPGGIFYFGITGITQTLNGQANACLLEPTIANLLVDILSGIWFPVELPGYSPIPVPVTLPIPFLGDITLQASFGPNELVFYEQAFDGIDLGSVPLAGTLGLNCRVDGRAQGGISPLDQDTLPGTVRITQIVAGPGSGLGPCWLTTPDGACTLHITLEGQ